MRSCSKDLSFCDAQELPARNPPESPCLLDITLVRPLTLRAARFFLAVARALNFTRAAEECHVAQPSLTRAIRQLEGELGGDLFRRERPQAQLTELGQRMLPLLKQCYDSAVSARSVASSTGPLASRNRRIPDFPFEAAGLPPEGRRARSSAHSRARKSLTR